MNLYRIDFTPDGKPSYPLRDLFGTYLDRSYGKARLRAVEVAKETGVPATVSKISGKTLRVTPAVIAMPTGNVRKAGS